MVKQQNAVNAKLDSVVAALGTIQSTLAYFVKQNRDINGNLNKAQQSSKEIYRTVDSWNSVIRQVDRFVKAGSQQHVRVGVRGQSFNGDMEITSTKAELTCEDPLQGGLCRLIGPYSFASIDPRRKGGFTPAH